MRVCVGACVRRLSKNLHLFFSEFFFQASETYNRLFYLDNEIKQNHDICQIFDYVHKSLFLIKISPRLITNNLEKEMIANELDNLERDAIFNDALRQLTHAMEMIDKANDEAIVEITETFSESTFDETDKTIYHAPAPIRKQFLME